MTSINVVDSGEVEVLSRMWGTSWTSGTVFLSHFTKRVMSLEFTSQYSHSTEPGVMICAPLLTGTIGCVITAKGAE